MEEQNYNPNIRRKLNEVRRNISDILELSFDGEFGKIIEDKTKELMENMEFAPGVEFYTIPYESIRNRLEVGDFHSSDFLKDVYELGKIFGADVPQIPSGFYISGKQVPKGTSGLVKGNRRAEDSQKL